MPRTSHGDNHTYGGDAEKCVRVRLHVTLQLRAAHEISTGIPKHRLTFMPKRPAMRVPDPMPIVMILI